MHSYCSPIAIFALANTLAAGAASGLCLPPAPPVLPREVHARQLYADLIRADFESYFSAVQLYLRCLDGERARAFGEAQRVTEDYRVFLSDKSGPAF